MAQNSPMSFQMMEETLIAQMRELQLRYEAQRRAVINENNRLMTMQAMLRRMEQENAQIEELMNSTQYRIQQMEEHLRRSSLQQDGLVESIFEKCTTRSTTKSTDECRICMKDAEHPIGCTSCNTLVGCLSCCKQWAQSSMERAGKPTCPLCRNEWKSSDDVEEMVTGNK